MTRWDDETLDDEAYERRLLESAQRDVAPTDAAAAWTRFASSVRTTAAATEPASGLHERGPRSTAEPLVESTQVVYVAASRAYVVRCLLLGALAGSSLTAAWFTWRQSPSSSSPTASSRQNTVAVADTAATTHTSQASSTSTNNSTAPVLAQPTTASAPSSAAHAVGSRPGIRSERLARTTTKRTAQAASSADVLAGLVPDEEEYASSLADEVARLDAARAASKRGAYEEAVRLVAGYHHDFPRGALAPDADLIAIEAVARQGDQAQLERLCMRFLELYPMDPHAARVRSLRAQ